MATTIQISEKLHEELSKMKIYENETYEDIIWSLVEDSMVLSEETKNNISKSEKEIKEGKTIKLEDIKKKMRL